MKEQLIKLTDRLNKIAKKNNDSFDCKLSASLNGDKGLFWEFVCKEDTEDHILLSGYGSTAEEALLDAESLIEDAIERWGYSE